ncbi:MAG: zinc ribbon domain-containing protein [Dehalococcoidia bacterium]
MTTIRQLFELQELDQQLAQRHSRLASLEGMLGNKDELAPLRESVEQGQRKLQELRAQQQEQELQVETPRQKLADLEAKMYGGTVTNPRELEGMQQEAGMLRRHLSQGEDRLLEVMLALEEAQGLAQEAEARLEEAEGRWQAQQEALQEEYRQLQGEVHHLETLRKEQAARVASTDLALYERLRAAKGGRPVARVERGMCRGCQVTLPTHELQRARTAREPLLCPSCGRILYLS